VPAICKLAVPALGIEFIGLELVGWMALLPYDTEAALPIAPVTRTAVLSCGTRGEKIASLS
jgi:hypothetical protein